MVGSYSPALDLRDISMGSRTRINMTLSRIVSRFDIINDEKLSHLTITGVSMGHGRKGVTFFPVVPVEDPDPTKTLITYPTVTLTAPMPTRVRRRGHSTVIPVRWRTTGT